MGWPRRREEGRGSKEGGESEKELNIAVVFPIFMIIKYMLLYIIFYNYSNIYYLNLI